MFFFWIETTTSSSLDQAHRSLWASRFMDFRLGVEGAGSSGSSSPSGRFVRLEMEGGSFEPSASKLENMDVRFRMEGGNFEPSSSDRASMRPWIQSFASS
ncbi:hypothetical protein F2Q68_00011931 [Brassica cretica]|uniref:Uncharacterized protein n=1 Tax=Brassica cretica TaxID=69181 RepID=A0A8S9KRG4_BRACR|nr:hypothetical protein F2Q68_00011931 [Brassica cretica]